MKSFSATVKSCTPVKKGYEIILDQTAFFPESGGQYGDTGFIDNVQVLDTYEKNKEIIHFTKEPLEEGLEVRCKLDWEKRFLKMQQHSAEHIVSGLVNKIYGYDNVGFHLGTEDSTIDFNGEITLEQLKELEWKANEVVVKNLDILELFPTKEEIEKLEFRSKIELNEGLRIIMIPDYDKCACCAPQLKKTGEIGLIKLTNVQKYKGGVRITMLCGFRALADYSRKEDSVKGISTLLSAKEKDVFGAVKSLKNEMDTWKQRNNELAKQLIIYKAREIPEKLKSVCLFERELSGEEPRYLMNHILEQGKDFCVVFCPDKEGYRYTMGSKTRDVREIAKAFNEKFQGRGGGKPNMVQGFIIGDEEEIRDWFEAQ